MQEAERRRSGRSLATPRGSMDPVSTRASAMVKLPSPIMGRRQSAFSYTHSMSAIKLPDTAVVTLSLTEDEQSYAGNAVKYWVSVPHPVGIGAGLAYSAAYRALTEYREYWSKRKVVLLGKT